MKPFFLAVSIAVLLAASPVHAHKMTAYWEVESTVHLEVFFADGVPAKGVEVTVLGRDGSQLVKGRTDNEGLFAFRPEGEGPFTVICQGELGHRTQVQIDLTGRSGQERQKVKKGVPLHEVFAGLGYIFGAAGILMWILSRRKAAG